MGKDKKEKNPADAFRKEQRKKELLKLKKDREVVRDVREMLNDPRKIDAEIIKAQKLSDENKLDKTLKDRIKELQRMRDVANTRQMVLAAQGKITKDELDNITKPSIYQNNAGVWEDPNAKAASSSQGHLKSASRISTEGLPAYRGSEGQMAEAMPLPTSVMMPYPPALTPAMQPIPRGYGAMPGRGMTMGGVGGIPLPPPRPMGAGGVPRGPPAGHFMGGSAPPPPPPRSLPPPGAVVPGYPYVPNLSPLPPGPPRGVPGQYAPPGFPPQSQVYPYMVPAQPMYGVPGYPGYPGMPMGNPYYPPPQMVPQPRPAGPPKERKARPPRKEETVDPLDPAAKGYTERFGTVAAKRAIDGRGPDAQERGSVESAPAGPMALPQGSAQAEVAGDQVDAAGPEHRAESDSEHSDAEDEAEDVTAAATPPLPPPPPPAQAQHSFVPPAYGSVLSAEELMRRRNLVPAPEAAADVAQYSAAGPAAGPAAMPPSYATLSAEELMRRRNLVVADSAPAATPAPEEYAGPSAGPMMPTEYGTSISTEQLMRRRYMVTTEPEEEGSDAGADSADEDVTMQAPARPPAHPQTGPTEDDNGEEEDAEALMRQKYYIPDMMQAEDVESDGEGEDDGVDGDADDRRSEVSDDEVRSAGDPAEFDAPGAETYSDDDGEFQIPALDLNVANLFPARLPPSFTQLPQPRVALPFPNLPATAPATAASANKNNSNSAKCTSAVNFSAYGDDDDEDEEDAYEQEEYVPEPAVRKIQPFAQPAPQAPPPVSSIPSTSAASSSWKDSEISRAIVKGPKIVTTDRALTAFVPNALKKKRLLAPGSTAPAPNSVAARKTAPTEAAEIVQEVAAEEMEPPLKSQRRSEFDPESLHAATSQLLRPTTSGAPLSGSNAGVSTFELTANAAINSAAAFNAKPALAPIAFVAAKTSVSVTASKKAAPSAEEDAFAQFFQEINQLDGSV